MLRKLSIKNFATINEIEIFFNGGFLVLTGQTGAGKSIIVGALNLISGKRADFSKFNDKTKKIIIEAEFNISSLEFTNFFKSNNIDYGDSLIVRREIMPNGKSRSFINDCLIRLEVLKFLSSKIIDIHSQHENLLLNDEFFQLNFLDSLLTLTDLGYSDTLKDFQKKFSENQDLFQKIEKFKLNSKSEKEKFEKLQSSILELQNANLKVGEKEEITKQHNLLNNIVQIKKSLNEILFFFQEENGVIAKMNKSHSQLSSISEYNDKLASFSERLSSSLIDLKDLNEEINLFQDRLSVDKNKLEEIEGRINFINYLEDKYFVSSVEDLLKKLEELSHGFSNLDTSNNNLNELEKKFNKNKEWLFITSKKLSKSRKVFATKIESILIKDLEQLGIKNANLQFSFKELANLNYYGKDSVELLFSANKGHDLKSIEKVASGGEISRLMLCIKKHLYLTKKISTIVFDEIDSGVSGQIAEKLGFFMKEIAKEQQIIAITHLPQIASISDDHYKVFKNELGDEKIETKINLLDNKNRVLELARLLSGKEITNEAIANAKKMLNI